MSALQMKHALKILFGEWNLLLKADLCSIDNNSRDETDEWDIR